MMYRLSQNVELVERDGGIYLVAKPPLSVLRINPLLAELVRHGHDGPLTAATPAEAAVLEQLAAKGFLERLSSIPEQPTAFPSVSVVIPVKDRAEELQRCLDSLAGLSYPPEKIQ